VIDMPLRTIVPPHTASELTFQVGLQIIDSVANQQFPAAPLLAKGGVDARSHPIVQSPLNSCAATTLLGATIFWIALPPGFAVSASLFRMPPFVRHSIGNLTRLAMRMETVTPLLARVIKFARSRLLNLALGAVFRHKEKR